MLRRACRPGPSRRLTVEALEERMLMAVTVGVVPVVQPPPHHSTVPAERLDVLERGVNLSRWFRAPDELSADWFTGRITDADLQQIRDLGFEHVRLPLSPDLFFHPESSSQPDAAMLGYLDAALDRILAHDLAVVVDLHDEDQLLEGDAAVVDQFVGFWSALAGHLSQYDADRVFFEVLNEPVFYEAPQEWFPIQTRLLAAMRAAAPEHTFIAAGPRFSHIAGLLLVPPASDTNVIYTFHFYEPFLFTHQGATWLEPSYEHLRGLPYPSTPANVAALASRLQATYRSPADAWIPAAVRAYGREGWNAAKLETEIRRAVAWAATSGVTLYVGEFGVHLEGGAKTADRQRWHQDVARIFDKYDIAWSVWDYDDSFGLVDTTHGGRTLDVGLARALGLKIPVLPPVNQLPAGLTVGEDGRLIFAGNNSLRIVNPNTATFSIEVTLTISQGNLSLSKRTGLSFAVGDGTTDRALRFQGSAAAVAAALANASFRPDANFFGPATIQFASRLVGASAAGSNGQPAVDSDLLAIQVLPVNDAPVISAALIFVPPGLFGTTPHAGIAIGSILAGRVTDADPAALQGIALTSIGSRNLAGWEFSLDGGATWQKVNTAGLSSALLLRGGDRLRFVGAAAPLATGPLGFAAWDQTSGAAGQRVNLLSTRTGGSSAFSTTRATASAATGVSVG